jgi:hypothetical protein
MVQHLECPSFFSTVAHMNHLSGIPPKVSTDLGECQIGSMSKDQESLIAADGLRYKSKEGGSPFKDLSSMASISCYKCGLHKPRAMGTFKKLINQSMFMCCDCTPAKSA